MLKSNTESNSGTTQRLPLGFRTTIELKIYIYKNTSDNTDTVVSRNIPSHLPLLSDVGVIFFSSVMVFTPNGNLWIVPPFSSVSVM
jgi:hypothetical protein